MREMFRASTHSWAPDVVFIPYLDYCVHLVALFGSPFGSVPWSGIVIRPTFHYRSMGIIAPKAKLSGLRKYAFRRMLRNPYLRGCLTVDEPLSIFVKQNWGSLGEKLGYLPDPAQPILLQPKSSARRAFGLPADGNVILIYGWLTGRKGISAILGALRDPRISSDTRALLVGRQDSKVKELMKSELANRLRKEGRLSEHEAWADEITEANAFSAADIVWLGYENHLQSSGVQIQASMAGVPVLATERGIIGWYTRKYRCGLTVAVEDASDVVAKIGTLLTTDMFQKDTWHATVAAIREQHSIPAAIVQIARVLNL